MKMKVILIYINQLKNDDSIDIQDINKLNFNISQLNEDSWFIYVNLN